MIYRNGRPVAFVGDTDAASAADPELARYYASATQPPERTDWGLVLVCAVALVTVSGAFVWGVRAAGR